MDDETDLAYDQHLADQAEEAAADYWRDHLMGEVEAATLAAIQMWITEHEGPLTGLKRTSTRVQFCAGLATMGDYMVDTGRDGMRLERLLAAITPPNGHPAWGNGKKPKNLFGHVTRLHDDKLAVHKDDRLQLTPLGILFAHTHGAVTFEEVVEYWRWKHKDATQRTTNIWFLRSHGGNVVEEPFQMGTPGSSRWASLRRLKGGKPAVTDYTDMSAVDLGRALQAVHKQDALKCWAVLSDVDRRRLIENVLARVEIPGFLVADIADVVVELETPKAQINQLTTYWAKANPLGPNEHGDVDVKQTETDAKKVIDELICRSAWYVVRNIMDFRVNDPSLADPTIGRFGKDPTKSLAEQVSMAAAATVTFDAATRTADLVESLLGTDQKIRITDGQIVWDSPTIKPFLPPIEPITIVTQEPDSSD